jgi:hypothetical protein
LLVEDLKNYREQATVKGVTGYAGGVTFSREQLDRYSRQLLLPGVGAAGQRKLLEAKVSSAPAGSGRLRSSTSRRRGSARSESSTTTP